MVLMTPSHMVLNSVKVMVKSESSFFSIGNKKKSSGARSGEWGGGGESPRWSSLPGRLHQLRDVNRCDVPVEDPLSRDQVGPFLPERLQKPLQGESPRWSSSPGRLHQLRDVNRCVVPVEDPLSSDQVGPFLPERLQKPPQGINNVCRIDLHAPGDVVGVHYALIVEEHEHHLLGVVDDDFGFNGAWCALFKPLHQLCLVSGVCIETVLSSIVTI
jgi:hypothetical protein